MKVYTVHMHRPTLDPERDIRLIKEGFNWPAFLFSFVWALWSRLWLIALGLLAASLVLNGALTLLGADAWTRATVWLGFAAIVGHTVNDLKRWTLFRRGFLQVAVVSGRDRDAAERRFWDQRPSLAADLVR